MPALPEIAKPPSLFLSAPLSYLALLSLQQSSSPFPLLLKSLQILHHSQSLTETHLRFQRTGQWKQYGFSAWIPQKPEKPDMKKQDISFNHCFCHQETTSRLKGAGWINTTEPLPLPMLSAQITQKP